MSLFGALFSGVSGLNAQSRAMGMISDNVANVNTTAYKGAQAQFANMVTRSRGSSTGFLLSPMMTPSITKTGLPSTFSLVILTSLNTSPRRLTSRPTSL